MTSLVLMALALGTGQTPPQLVRALPCGPRYQPMAIRIAAADPRPRPADRVVPLPRPGVPRRAPCFRLAGAVA